MSAADNLSRGPAAATTNSDRCINNIKTGNERRRHRRWLCRSSVYTRSYWRWPRRRVSACRSLFE